MPHFADEPGCRPKKSIRSIAALCLLIAGAVTILPSGHAQNPQLEKPACQKCWEGCVNARDTCLIQACAAGGGTNSPSACVGVKNQKAHTDALAGCSKQENVCTDKCYVAGGPCSK